MIGWIKSIYFYLATSRNTQLKCADFDQTAKYSMKDLSNPIVKQKLEIDSELFTQLQGLGIVSGLNELSELCGKNSTYFSCMRIRGYSAHVGSLAFLASRLAAKLEREKCVRERAKFRTALEAVNRAITEKCRLREIELHA